MDYMLTTAACSFSDFYNEILDYHGMQQTGDLAVTTGWGALDEFYKVCQPPRGRQPSTMVSPACCLLLFIILTDPPAGVRNVKV